MDVGRARRGAETEISTNHEFCAEDSLMGRVSKVGKSNKPMRYLLRMTIDGERGFSVFGL